MAKYAASNTQGGTQQAVNTTGRTLLALTGVTASRGKIYSVIFGADSTPDDLALVWEAVRCTSVGTGGTTVTPSPFDAADGAADIVGTANPTAEPTTAALKLLDVAANQRTTYTWVALPGNELVIPATASNGFALRARGPAAGGTFAGTAIVTAHFEE